MYKRNTPSWFDVRFTVSTVVSVATELSIEVGAACAVVVQTINNRETVLTGNMSVGMVEHILRVKYVTVFDIQDIDDFEDTYVLIENGINMLDILPTINYKNY